MTNVLLKSKPIQISEAGTSVATVNVTFSPQFLALLSEHLYSSPNKAFEELISNSWDANADSVYVRIPDNLTDPNAAIWILDNGNSMDVSGFEQLWSIAKSGKRKVEENGRKQIGKFGIGKLATYVLCNELTYICKAKDSVIRIITMDYRLIDYAKSEHIDALPLKVREIKSYDELNILLNNFDFGVEVSGLIKGGVPSIKMAAGSEDEFGGQELPPVKIGDTWTLAILTTLKDDGKNIQEGWIKRLLRTALPLGNTISLDVNGEIIRPSKSNKPIAKTWIIGPDLDFDEIEIDNGTLVKINKVKSPYPHVQIEGLGELTGKATLYEQNIRGGKSDKISESNGFFVNVLGRVINPDDNLFKLADLNLSVLSQFRTTLRVDGLDKQISANRESIAESYELKVVRSLLRKLFNLARREFNKVEEKKFTEASKGRKDEINSVPVIALNDLLHRALEDKNSVPLFVDVNIENLKEEKEAWIEATKDDLGKSISTIEFNDASPNDLLAKYDLKTRQILVNKNHPFSKENSHTPEQARTLKDSAFVDLLTDAYLLNCGISNDVYYDIVQHRDRALRLIAQIRRNSASLIISTLDEWKDEAKPFEEIVGDAIEYIGLSVQRYGGSGEPEGVATAYVTPKLDDEIAAYTFTYDAKSTKHKKAQTGNVHIAGLARHRAEYKADYSLVVAPDFQNGALEKEATDNKITPMRAKTLARLVSLTVGFGPINLVKFKELFSLYTPDQVDVWVNALAEEMKGNSIIDLKIVVSALEKLVTKGKIDILGCDAIAQKYREITGKDTGRPSRTEIAQLFRGLSLVAPNAVFIDPNKGFDVFILTRPSMLIEEIKRQTKDIPANLKMGSLSETKND